MLRTVLAFQLAVLRRNPLAALCLLAAVAEVLVVARLQHRWDKPVAYLCAVGAGLFLTDLFVQWKGAAPLMPVRHGARESIVLLLFTLIGYLVMFGRFAWLDWARTPGWVKWCSIALFAFVFPVASAVYLWRQGYRPRDLGFRWTGSAWVFLPIVAVVGGTAYAVAPAELTLQRIWAEEGIAGFLIDGFVAAALAEEFMRLTLQTRIGAWWNNGMGWILAAVVWAFLHLPMSIGEGADPAHAVLGCCYIVPIGLLWGYLTHRTRSIWPAILCHGLNVWGLQNL